MKIIEFTGNHYELGKTIGELSEYSFSRYIKPSAGFKQLAQWVSSSWFRDSVQLIRRQYPSIYQELQGIAEGANQSMDEILLWNCRGDLINCIPEGCTSLGVTQKNITLVAHNEDGDPALKDQVFLIKATMQDSASFTSFVYPASIPGHSFAMNEHGVAFTVNNIRLTEKQAGIPRMVLSRALLESRDYKDFISICESTIRSGAFHFTVADLTYNKALSVEAPFQDISVIEARPVVVHANHLVHHDLDFVPQIITDSSASRQARMEELGYAYRYGFDVQTCLKILQDRHQNSLPIFRQDADDPDKENTLATAVFSFEQNELTMRVFEPGKRETVYTQTMKL